MPLSWQRSLNRLVVNFFEGKIPGLVREPNIMFARDGRETIEARFLANEQQWKLTIDSSEEHPPTGWLRLYRDNDQVYADVIDSTSFDAAARAIKESKEFAHG